MVFQQMLIKMLLMYVYYKSFINFNNLEKRSIKCISVVQLYNLLLFLNDLNLLLNLPFIS